MIGDAGRNTPTQRRANHVDRYGVAVLLVVLTMIATAVSGTAWWGQLLALLIEGGTFLFILLTSGVRPPTFAWTAVAVGAAIAAAAVSAYLGGTFATAALYGIGALMSLVAPVVIARRLLAMSQITVSTISGALCLYL